MTGPLDEELLQKLATSLHAEWTLIAMGLGVAETRVQEIKAKLDKSEVTWDEAMYEMFTCWHKKSKVEDNKVLLHLPISQTYLYCNYMLISRL